MKNTQVRQESRDKTIFSSPIRLKSEDFSVELSFNYCFELKKVFGSLIFGI